MLRISIDSYDILKDFPLDENISGYMDLLSLLNIMF